MEKIILSGDQIAYQDQTLKLIKGVKYFSEELIHSFNTTDSFGRINRNQPVLIDHFFSFSYFNYEGDDKLPWASHIHYEKFLGQPYFSFKDINQVIDIEDILRSLGISKEEFYDKYLHSNTKSQISYLDKKLTAKAIQGDLYKTLIDSTVFKKFYKGVIRNLFEISTDDNKNEVKNYIREISGIVSNSQSLLSFNKDFVKYFLDDKITITENFDVFDTKNSEFYTVIDGRLNNYEIYKNAYNDSIQGSTLKPLKTGDLPFFGVDLITKTREEIFYDSSKNEIIINGNKKIPFVTIDKLLPLLKEYNIILIPKALMLSYQKLLIGDLIQPKKGSEYTFLLHKFYKNLQKNGIMCDINKILLVEFNFFKELGNLNSLKIPFKLAKLLGLSIGDQENLDDTYIKVSGRDFYNNYMKKYDEANQTLSIIKNSRDNIVELMKNIKFAQLSDYEQLNITAKKALDKIKNDKILKGKITPQLIKEKNDLSKEILNIKKVFYNDLLQIVMDCEYLSKLDKNSFRPYILWLLAINPELINKLVNNAQITTFDIKNGLYQNQ